MPGINLLAVLIASVISFSLSVLWYSRFLFGGKWIEPSKMGHADIGNKARKRYKTLPGIFMAELTTAYALAYLIALTGSYSTLALFELIFWVWLGFAVAVSLNHVFREGQPWSVYFINIGYHLTGWMIMGLIIVYLSKLL